MTPFMKTKQSAIVPLSGHSLDGYMVSFRNVFIPNSLHSDTSSFRSANFLSLKVRHSENTKHNPNPNPEIVHFNFRIEDVSE